MLLAISLHFQFFNDVARTTFLLFFFFFWGRNWCCMLDLPCLEESRSSDKRKARLLSRRASELCLTTIYPIPLWSRYPKLDVSVRFAGWNGNNIAFSDGSRVLGWGAVVWALKTGNEDENCTSAPPAVCTASMKHHLQVFSSGRCANKFPTTGSEDEAETLKGSTRWKWIPVVHN